MSHEGKSALDILGSPDDLKFRSCLTLFAEAASDDARALFKHALDQFYGGEADHRTMELLGSTSMAHGMARTVQPSSRKAELGRAPFTKPSTSSWSLHGFFELQVETL